MTSIEKIKQIGDCTLYLGDSYNIIKDLQENSISLIHTDPPYEMKTLSNKGMGKFGTLVAGKSIEKLSDPLITEGLNFEIFEDFKRVCKNPNFQIWCNKKMVYRILTTAEENQWNWQDIKLCRNNALPLVMGKYQDSEYCFHLWKGRILTGNYINKAPVYFYTIGNKEYDHPALKPTKPIENLILVGSNPGDTVLDPFMGSGTTGVSCIRTGRKFIGIELQEKYFEMSCKRIEEEHLKNSSGSLFNLRKG